MNVRLLVDGIVRQTTVLLAQLSTTAGVRAPLAHIADQVFIDLAREIEAQGVSRKVAADMFGLALRSYQKKVQRLTASATDRNRTLWQAMLDFLRDGSKPRAVILQRFQYDWERDVGAILNDLVSNGLVYCTGKGDGAIYGLTSDADLHAVVAETDLRSIANVVWLHVFLGEARTEEALATLLGIEVSVVATAAELLVRESNLVRVEDAGLEARDLIIPVGATEGWEAAVLDHHRAMSTAVAAKAAAGPTSARNDEVGGGTLTFSIYPGHPHEAEVRALLASVRTQVNVLFQKITAHAEEHPPSDDDAKVTFYFGQLVTEPSEAFAASEPAPPESAESLE
jgi:hypothetical protein